MNHKKIVQEILGKELEKEGFRYASGDAKSWCYERTKNGVWQIISVVRERYCKGYIKMVFTTNAYGQKDRELNDFVPEELPEYWHYETEEELRQIIVQFKEWVFAYGMKGLEKMSQPATEAHPKPETNRYLYEHHKELYEEYRQKMQIEDDNWKDVVKKIQKRIEETWDRPFKEMEGELIGLSALYAYALNEGEEGNWRWHEKASNCMLVNVAGTINTSFPLQEVIAVWDSRDTQFLESEYKTVQIYVQRESNDKESINQKG